MTYALQLPPAGEPAEAAAGNHGAEAAVARALGLSFPFPIALPPPLPKQPAQNFIARHWRGELALPRSYWINHLALGAGTGIAAGALASVIEHGGDAQPVRWLISLGLAWGVIILFSLWSATGVWRAATAYRRAGKRFWGVAAKATVALGAIHLVYSVLCVAIPQAAGIYEIVTGDKRIGQHQFKVMGDGTMLDFSGGISFGTAKEFETMLNAMEHVTTVRLNSNGGRIAEAQKISDLIRARGLSTYVTQSCVSACTIIYLGGKQRYLFTTAKLGFHQPYFRGMTEIDQRMAIAREQARLQQFGLSPAFAARANAASHTGMWFPDQEELLRERVVTKIVMPPPPKPVIANPTQPAPAVPFLQGTPAAYRDATR